MLVIFYQIQGAKKESENKLIQKIQTQISNRLSAKLNSYV